MPPASARPANTLKSFMQTIKRAAPSEEPTWLRSSKKQKIQAASPNIEKRSAKYIPADSEAPRSNIYTPPVAADHGLTGHQLEAEGFELFYKRSKGIDHLRCRMNVLAARRLLVVDFRLPKGETVNSVSAGKTTARVVVTEILAEDEENYVCEVETVVYDAVWYAKLMFEKVHVDEHLVLRWLASRGDTGEIRETIEECPPLDVEAASCYFRTISVIDRPRTECAEPDYRFLVGCWSCSTTVELQGTIVEREVVYRGDEKEKRLWLKLKLRLVSEKAVACYIFVSGDVESEAWVHGRFRDECPGQLSWE